MRPSFHWTTPSSLSSSPNLSRMNSCSTPSLRRIRFCGSFWAATGLLPGYMGSLAEVRRSQEIYDALVHSQPVVLGRVFLNLEFFDRRVYGIIFSGSGK